MKYIILFFAIFISITDQSFLTKTAYAESPTSESIDFGELEKKLDSSLGIIIISGISTVYSYTLYNAAEKQEQESQKNIVKIDKMIASFKDSYAGYCPKGRDDLSDPKCYCYSATGAKNNNRTNSQTCIDLWAKNAYMLAATATNYNLAAVNADVAGCINVNGAFDENCKCRKLVNSKGQNACKKETTLSMPNDAFSTGLATAGGATDLLKFANNSSNGNPRFDLINSASIGAKAIKSRQIADALITKLDGDIKIPKIDDSNVDKYAKAILGTKNFENKMNSGSSMATNVSSARSENPLMESALKKAEEKAGLVMTGGNGLNAKKDKKKMGFDLNIGGDSGGNSGSQVVQDFPEEKNYKFKNSDIVTDNSASIFEIISNRYVLSGLKRLFDDEDVK